MATESISKSLVINNPKGVERFVDTLEESEQDLERRKVIYRDVRFTDQDAIRRLMTLHKNREINNK